MYKMLITTFFIFSGIGVLKVQKWIFSMYNLQCKNIEYDEEIPPGPLVGLVWINIPDFFKMTRASGFIGMRVLGVNPGDKKRVLKNAVIHS